MLEISEVIVGVEAETEVSLAKIDDASALSDAAKEVCPALTALLAWLRMLDISVKSAPVDKVSVAKAELIDNACELNDAARLDFPALAALVSAERTEVISEVIEESAPESDAV
ncbi:hypothetical protein EJ03DRAFT_352310 [Teratosphaeria nubilosa]|uniref:Uncharacterized protein n=1 Tax=Teratosphaeria nubilosa TaxID=161662 RepID=A0A6G1L7K3_9PEZI|nr:hypothetical protein EJ03DRAFT_352310 [Teratosphaeria nubilosa]